MTRGRTLLSISIAAMMAGASANPALADDRTMTVSGNSVPSECGAPKSPTFAIELSGNLEGCLAIFVQHFNCRAMNGFDFSTELGREEFEGTLDGKSITFDTLYEFTAIWPTGSCPSPAHEAEIAGGCVHHVSGEGIQGVIRFYDVIPTVGQGATNFFYEGVLTVSDDATAAIAPVLPSHRDVAVAEPARSLRSVGLSGSC
jgi:hypothetical protein